MSRLARRRAAVGLQKPATASIFSSDGSSFQSPFPYSRASGRREVSVASRSTAKSLSGSTPARGSISKPVVQGDRADTVPDEPGPDPASAQASQMSSARVSVALQTRSTIAWLRRLIASLRAASSGIEHRCRDYPPAAPNRRTDELTDAAYDTPARRSALMSGSNHATRSARSVMSCGIGLSSMNFASMYWLRKASPLRRGCVPSQEL